MQRWLALVLLLGSVLVAGCVTGEGGSSTRWMRGSAFRGPAGADVVQLEIALLERPLGDPFLNEELWQSVDERVVGPQERAVMESAGFRVGQMNALLTPPQFLQLLTSERWNVAPHALRNRAGKPTPLTLGAPHEICRFKIDKDGEPEEVEFHRAECRLVVVATPTTGQSTTLRFTPQVIHGERDQAYRVSEDRSTLMLVTERPTETYADLAWEATLGPNEYIVIGGRYDDSQTPGHQFFVRPDEAKPVQRLLVIRAATTSRSAGENADQKSPALAQQAAWSATGSTPRYTSRVDE